MWRYFGLTKRGKPSEAGSVEAKLDLIIQEILKQDRSLGRLITSEDIPANAVFPTPKLLANVINPIMSRHGIPIFAVEPLRKDKAGYWQLVIRIPEDIAVDILAVDDEITRELRDMGMANVLVLFAPLSKK